MKCPQLPNETFEAIDRLERFWSFPRKKLTEQIRLHLDAFQHQTQALHEHCKQLESLSSQQTLELEKLHEHKLAQQSKIESLDHEIEEQLVSYRQLQARQIEAAQRIGQLETQVSRQSEDLESKSRSLVLMQEASDQWEALQANLQDNLEEMEKRHMTLHQKFDLVQRTLAVEAPSNEGLDVFGKLIEEKYLDFAARESSLADEAGALLELQGIRQELELIVDFPSVRGKTLLAVAGGFSSGKSKFINSFIRAGAVELAVGMNPVTVVPSYVISAETPSIRGYAANGGAIDLDEKLYKSLSHEYLESFGFDLRKIMPFISVQVPMQEDLFEHLCLIDTPGYNAGGGQAMAADFNVAQALTRRASAMIWVVGLGSDGTISRSDLDFIENANLLGESLYIVLNKADTKSAEAIDEILEHVGDELSSYGFEFAGMCAYSSRKGRFYASCGQSLEDFLRTHNHRNDVQGEIAKRIDAVFDLYKRALEDDLSMRQKQRKHFDDGKLKALQTGGTASYQDLCDFLAPAEAGLTVAPLEAFLKECETLRGLFKDAATRTLAEALYDLESNTVKSRELSAG